MRGKVMIIGAIVIVAVAAGGAVGIREAKHGLAAQEACRSVREYAATVGQVQKIGSGPAITVLGDSYSTGDELWNRSDTWTHTFADAQQRELDVVAQGGTGFAASGFCGDGAYGQRVQTAAALGNDMTIIQGGLNDVAEPEAVRTAARRVLSKLHGELVVVGPVDAPAVHGEAAIDRALRAAARSEGAAYVSALKWDDLVFGDDGKHLTPAGHRSYAHHLADAI